VQQGNTWHAEVDVLPAFDLEGLCKAIAVLEMSDVDAFVEEESAKLKAATPRDVLELWTRAFEELPLLRRLGDLFEVARQGDHSKMASMLRIMRVDIIF
jgi:hypothetical protein